MRLLFGVKQWQVLHDKCSTFKKLVVHLEIKMVFNSLKYFLVTLLMNMKIYITSKYDQNCY